MQAAPQVEKVTIQGLTFDETWEYHLTRIIKSVHKGSTLWKLFALNNSGIKSIYSEPQIQ